MSFGLRSIGIVGALATLSACATVVDEQRGSVTVSGITYTTVITTYESNGTRKSAGSVLYNSKPYGCDPTKAGSCEEMVETLQSGFLDRDGRNALDSSNFVVTGM